MTAEPAASSPPTAATSTPFPARIGAALTSPRAALRAVDARGGGVRDAFLLVLLGVLAFRLEDVARAVLSVVQVSPGQAVQQLLIVVVAELREAVTLVLPAGLLVTIFAGRGRRDPGLDIELGALCYVPFFAVRAVFRLLDIDALLGPLPFVGHRIANGVAVVWAIVVLVIAIRIARARVPREADAQKPDAPLVPRRPDRIAAAALAAVLGGALFLNIGWLTRNTAAVRPVGKGTLAPDFTLPRIDGQPGSIALSSLRGQVVLLDFWASWCAPCVAMLPALHDLHGEWRARGVEFVGINSDGPGTTREDLQAFLAEHRAPYPIVLDDREVGGLYKVTALPHMVVVGRDGVVQAVFWGTTTRGELAAALRRAAD